MTLDGRTYTEAGYETYVIHLKRDYFDYNRIYEELNKDYQKWIHKLYKLQHLDTIRTICIAPVINAPAKQYLKIYSNKHLTYHRPGCKKIRLYFYSITFERFLNRYLPKMNPRVENQFLHLLADAIKQDIYS